MSLRCLSHCSRNLCVSFWHWLFWFNACLRYGITLGVLDWEYGLANNSSLLVNDWRFFPYEHLVHWPYFRGIHFIYSMLAKSEVNERYIYISIIFSSASREIWCKHKGWWKHNGWQRMHVMWGYWGWSDRRNCKVMKWLYNWYKKHSFWMLELYTDMFYKIDRGFERLTDSC